jgi:hypothetical protein
MAAREMGELPLSYALEFCFLLADLEAARWRRAIARWHARLVLEAPRMTVDESLLALSAAQALAGRERATAAYTLQRRGDGLHFVRERPIAESRQTPPGRRARLAVSRFSSGQFDDSPVRI